MLKIKSWKSYFCWSRSDALQTSPHNLTLTTTRTTIKLMQYSIISFNPRRVITAANSDVTDNVS